MPGPGTWSPGDVLTADDLNAIGAWTAFTPAVVQSGAVSTTVNFAEYTKINRMVMATVDLTCTSSGTSGSTITVSLPVNLSTNTTLRTLGSGLVFDASANDVILVTAIRSSASTLRLVTDTTTDRNNGLGSDPVFALANNDVISLSLMYYSA